MSEIEGKKADAIKAMDAVIAHAEQMKDVIQKNHSHRVGMVAIALSSAAGAAATHAGKMTEVIT